MVIMYQMTWREKKKLVIFEIKFELLIEGWIFKASNSLNQWIYHYEYKILTSKLFLVKRREFWKF